MQEKMEYFNMENPVDKAFINGYNKMLPNGLRCTLERATPLTTGAEIAKCLKMEEKSFLMNWGNKIEKGNTNGTESFILKNNSYEKDR